MVEIIGIQFRGQGKIYYFSPDGMNVKTGEYCVVETSRGTECGEVVMGNRMMPETMIVQPLKPILRIATNEDMRKLQENARREKEAWDICQNKITEHSLDMKLVEVEYSFDGSKILFYFTSDGRVDFRELVKDLAAVFRTRIELRQIGVRDEAKTLGGIGICGRPLCCSEYLNDFQPVSIKMAKEQGLSLNPTKISGTCGRLMCCLKYEQDAYEDLIKNTPKVGAQVECNEGIGTVIDINLLTGICKIRIDGRDDAAVVACNRKELKLLNKDGNVIRDYSCEEKQDDIADIMKNTQATQTPKQEKKQETKPEKKQEVKPEEMKEAGISEYRKKTVRREKRSDAKTKIASDKAEQKAKPQIHNAIFTSDRQNAKAPVKKAANAESAAEKKIVIHDGLLASDEAKVQPKKTQTEKKEHYKGKKNSNFKRQRKSNKNNNS